MNGERPPSICFICDFPPGFSGARYHDAGVGGTEALVVVLAEALSKAGIAVTVATPIDDERCDRGVRYQPVTMLRPRGSAVTVLVKRWSDRAIEAGPVRVFLATDVHVPDRDGLARCLRWSTSCLALSPFMRDNLTNEAPAAEMGVLPPPIDLEDYSGTGQSRDPVLLYCSVPDRGLYYLKDLFPAIRRRAPDARLVITSDFSLWGRAAARDAFVRYFQHQPGIEYLGHVDRGRLVAEQRRARVLAYPCIFPEGFCIAAAECMAAGAVPVTTDAFALTTTVGDAGVLIAGRPRSWLYRRRFVRAAVALLTDDRHWLDRSIACRTRAQSYGSQAVAGQFLAHVSTAGKGV